MTKEELRRLIEYVVEKFIPKYKPLQDKDGDSYFNFKFKDYGDYTSWKEFCDDIERQSYVLKLTKISDDYIQQLVNDGKLYLFELYCRDFSEAAKKNHSRKNLHTLYFEELFDKDNLDNLRFKLNGGAMMFFRKGTLSLKDTTIHKANEPIKNKNRLNEKQTSTFDYALIKNKRYTEDQFFLHLPITINPNSPDIKPIGMNVNIREDLKSSEKFNIIGIDRGERNLIYITVINQNGKILEQKSLNTIVNEYKGNTYSTNYHNLLDVKEKDRQAARQNWQTIENIKELKEGYISLCVNEIVKLVRKYNAVIAMEDLNGGFKNSRKKVEKQVYQKFEKQLIEKLNYAVDKKVDANEISGVLNGLQLTNKIKSFKDMSNQNGIIFYVGAWLTSKIDPTTGFVNLIYPKYENIEKSKEFINNIDLINYMDDVNLFKFNFNFTNFRKGNTSYIKNWEIYSYGNRLKNYRNPQNNNHWDTKEINLTESFKELFVKYNINITQDIKKQLLEHNEKDLFEKFLSLLSLTLQMRNSKTGTDIDYMVSPVKNAKGIFYESEDHDATLPLDADANGAYHIALKMLMIIKRIKEADDVKKVKLAISNEEWLEFAQGRFE